MAQKYDLKKGDSIILSDEEDEMDYAFQVADIKQYSSGLYAFMDIDSMRSLSDIIRLLQYGCIKEETVD